MSMDKERSSEIGDSATSPRNRPTALDTKGRDPSSPIIDHFPGLKGRLPWRSIGTFPTPVEPFLGSEAVHDGRLYVKRDDLSSPLYGGNKVRKLEHVLAEASQLGRKTLITVGGLGSNQCLATAIHGRTLGFEVDICLFNQPIIQHVIDVLLADTEAGARILYGGGYVATAFQVIKDYAQRKWSGKRPYYVPPGSTSPLGAAGYASAGLELAAQIRAGTIPEPDWIYVAAGSCGTVAGLMVGLKLAGIRSRCVAVQITSGLAVNRFYIRRVARQTSKLLHDLDPAIPLIRFDSRDFVLEKRFFGGEYGRPTSEAQEALEWASPQLKLETTYTAKALAACLHHRRTQPRDTLLFWNTFNSAPVKKSPSLDVLPAKVRARITYSGRRTLE